MTTWCKFKHIEDTDQHTIAKCDRCKNTFLFPLRTNIETRRRICHTPQEIADRCNQFLANRQVIKNGIVQKKDNTTKIPKKDLWSKIKRYNTARRKWVDAGKPTRTNEDIVYIYDNICSPCDHFTGSSCDICGCGIKRSGHALNKLAWFSEKCADTPPKWLEFEEGKHTNQTNEPKNELKDEKKNSGCGGCGKTIVKK